MPRFTTLPHSRYSCLISTVFLLLLTAMVIPARSADWPQHLGPHRNGISAETGLIDEWPADGLPEVFRVPGGVGMSGLAISRGMLVTLVQRSGQQFVMALDAKTGKTNWATPVAPAYTNGMGNGPRATPAIVDDQIFAFTGEGILVALNFESGKILWSQNVVNQLGGKIADYGMACSPLVVDDRVIVTAGASQGTVAAFSIKTGEKAWAVGSDPAGYSSPALFKIAGKNQLVTYTGSSVLGIAPDTGALLWRYPYITDYECNIATPLAIDGQVFISSGENHGCTLLGLKPNGDKFDVTETWASQGSKSVLRNEWQTSMLLDGYLYGFDNGGSAGPLTHLTCIDAKTGDRQWQKIRFGKGNGIAADGKLLISTMKGEFVLVRANREEFQEIGRATVIGKTRQAPALADGLVYLRDDNEIVCLDLRKP
ncbi:PQQ-like beta-propeller repeat protein [Planctomycetaceae bacterium]|nr:PQQ-like beta-propeller repeat protein [Planctomycetaceae bacterium]MDC0308362.1 PQQ-like beta-propeller repeat protein [Planctomycetaceae bacterium]MDG2389308.1 PQQ-binding-like beta-propeller repeat protein [Planctomycetaceae bacterium]